MLSYADSDSLLIRVGVNVIPVCNISDKNIIDKQLKPLAQHSVNSNGNEAIVGIDCINNPGPALALQETIVDAQGESITNNNFDNLLSYLITETNSLNKTDCAQLPAPWGTGTDALNSTETYTRCINIPDSHRLPLAEHTDDVTASLYF